jgi:hypothetical protein
VGWDLLGRIVAKSGEDERDVNSAQRQAFRHSLQWKRGTGEPRNRRDLRNMLDVETLETQEFAGTRFVFQFAKNLKTREDHR